MGGWLDWLLLVVAAAVLLTPTLAIRLIDRYQRRKGNRNVRT